MRGGMLPLADPALAPLCRSRGGSITPDQAVAPSMRSSTHDRRRVENVTDICALLANVIRSYLPPRVEFAGDEKSER